MTDLQGIAEQISDQIRNKKIILFVGSGVSMNLKLPSWSQLIDRLAAELDYDPGVFGLLGNAWTLAEYYSHKKKMAELRSWMDRTWHDSSIDITKSRVHELIVELNFPLIYTTNYDRWIEKAYEAFKCPYAKIADVEDLAKAQEGVTQIIKLHGDFDSSDDSIVLTESSYFERLSFEAPLDIRLRADVLGKAILFVGYSLSDVNIRYLIYRLHKLWQSYNHRGRPPSYILLSKPNPVEEAILKERKITPIVLDHDDPGEALTALLQKIRDIS